MLMPDARALLLEAIPRQELGQIAQAMLDGQHGAPEQAALQLAEQARDACRRIAGEMHTAIGSLETALAHKGVAAHLAVEREFRPFHSATSNIARTDFSAAAEVLASLGYSTAIAITPARAHVLARSARQVQFIRFDDVTTRIILRLDPPPRSILPRALRPGLVDLALVDLPRWAAPAYWLAKPVRVAAERIFGRRRPHYEIDFLGTPASLIAPILRALDAGPEDVLLDVGCGDGRVLRVAAEQFGCRAIGIEHNADLAERARQFASASTAADRIEIREGDASSADLQDATIVFMFLPLRVLKDIMPGIHGRLQAGARVVMHEQSRPPAEFPVARSIPVFSQNGVTVVHVAQMSAKATADGEVDLTG